jgi:thioredoxin-related protein
VVSLAHKFAFESPYIQADGVSSVQLPELASEYGVLGTPHTVIFHGQGEPSSGAEHLRGLVSEAQLLEVILKVHTNV